MTMVMTSTRPVLRSAGIGLRLPHIVEVVAARPHVGWLEIHPENFLANPHALELLTELLEIYPISVHTVGISVGSAAGIDRLHLSRIGELVDRIDPVFISGHLAWSTRDGEYFNDLLPLPFNREALELVATHLNEVQDTLGRPYLVENPASYVGFRTTTMSEAEFLSELVLRTGCRLLCDVSNVYVSARNMDYDPYTYIDNLPADAISELHLGGYTAEEGLLIDTHAGAIADPSWELYKYAVGRIGPRPTLIEWDNDIPPLETLVAEAAQAEAILSQAGQREACCAAR
jgi:uncharacterized protein (UPF0276 family)